MSANDSLRPNFIAEPVDFPATESDSALDEPWHKARLRPGSGYCTHDDQTSAEPLSSPPVEFPGKSVNSAALLAAFENLIERDQPDESAM